jgi:hypothetical protein
MACKRSGVGITLCLPVVGLAVGLWGSFFGLKMPLCPG